MPRVLTICAALLAAGCGFQLQGAPSVPQAMERTYIAGDDTYSPFYRRLSAGLREAGVEVVAAPADATAVFSISRDETDQRVLSVSARNVPTEYEVYYTIEYAVDNGAGTLLPPQSLTITRNYTYDSTLVLGKAREEELLRDAIVDDLVRIVLKRISTL